MTQRSTGHTERTGGSGVAPGTRVALLACFAASGFCGLVYQIGWIRKATLVFGAATFAVSTVFAVFFLGLALGCYLFGRLSIRTRRPLQAYAALELILGVLGIASPLLFGLGEALFGRLYPSLVDHFVLRSLVRLVAVAIVILLPCVLMGGTLPLFCRQLVLRHDAISRGVGRLYALNTAGAAAGAALAGFWLIPTHGVDTTLRVAGAINLAIGATTLALARHLVAAPVAAENEPAAPATAGRSARLVLYGAFFVTGFVGLGHEVILTRFLALLVQSSAWTYPLVVCVTLVGIVVGSLLASLLFDFAARRELLLGALMAASGLTVLGLLGLPAERWLGWTEGDDVAQLIPALSLLLLGPAVLAGAAFPLAVRMIVSEPTWTALGVGRVTAVNTVGGVLGSLFVGFVALVSFGLHATVLITTGLAVAAAVAVWLRLDQRTTLRTRLALAAGAAGLWVFLAAGGRARLPEGYLFRPPDRLIDARPGVTGELAVVERGGRTDLEIDRWWQGTREKSHQLVAAHVPMLLHPAPKRVAVIGIGAGQACRRFLMYDELETLVGVDIERALVDLIAEHFGGEWMRDERFRLVIEDGRNFITHSDEPFDVISIEVGQITRPGVAAFYTRQFYEAARARLRDGGVLCQFVPVPFFRLDDFRSILATFTGTFPQAVLWYNTSELLLLGFDSDRLVIDVDRLGLLARDEAIREDLAFSHWGGATHALRQLHCFLGGLLLGPDDLADVARGGRFLDDDLPYLEYHVRGGERMAERYAIVDVIRRHLTPIESLLSMPPAAELAARIEGVRSRNLGDILAEPLLDAAQADLARGARGSAERALRHAIDQNADNVRANRMLADLLHHEGRWDEAVTLYNAALALDPGFAEALYGRALTRQRLGQEDGAVDDLEQALRERPDHLDSLIALGTMLAKRGELPRSTTLLRRALAIDGGAEDARSNLAFVLTMSGAKLGDSGKLVEAREAFLEAVSLDPDLQEARTNLRIAEERLAGH